MTPDTLRRGEDCSQGQLILKIQAIHLEVQRRMKPSAFQQVDLPLVFSRLALKTAQCPRLFTLQFCHIFTSSASVWFPSSCTFLIEYLVLLDDFNSSLDFDSLTLLFLSHASEVKIPKNPRTWKTSASVITIELHLFQIHI